MKMKKQFMLLFVVAFIFHVSLTVIGMWSLFSAGVQDLAERAQLEIYLGFVSLVISPFLAFFAFYFIGKRVNLSSELKWTIIALFIGNTAGSFVVQVIFYGIMIGYNNLGTLWLTSLLYAILNKELFVMLAGLALAYIRQNKTAPITESPSSSIEKSE